MNLRKYPLTVGNGYATIFAAAIADDGSLSCVYLGTMDRSSLMRSRGTWDFFLLFGKIILQNTH